MKLLILTALIFMSFSGFSKEVKNFNKVLIREVQKDIQNENDQTFRKKNSPMRGPASVSEERTAPPMEETKIDKNVKQLGHKNW